MKTKQIRKKFQIKQKEEIQKIDENAYKWVASNIILINEQIDRNAIRRLTNSIVKFDETFGPYKDKIPALAAKIERAEEGLSKAVTGKANDKKVSDMLQRTSYLYSTLSKFFTKDLPVLLRTPLFAAPRTTPNVQLSVLQPQSGVKYDAAAIRDSFRYALEPDAMEKKLLSKIYRKQNIPLLDSLAIATQMLHLNYDELEKLTKIGKVPMVAVDEDSQESPPPPPPPSQEEETTQKESVARNQKKSLTTIRNEAQKRLIVNEAAFDKEKFKKLSTALTNLQNVIKPFGDKVPTLEKAVEAAQAKVRAVQSSVVANAFDKVKGIFNQNVEADIINTLDSIKDFVEVWPQIQNLLPTNWDPDQSISEFAVMGEGVIKEQPEAMTAEIDGQQQQTAKANMERNKIYKDMHSIISKAVSGPFLSFKKQLIDPDTFAKELMALSPNEIQQIVGINIPQPQDITPSPELKGNETEKTVSTSATNKTDVTQGEEFTEKPDETQQTGVTPPQKTQEQSNTELEKIARDLVKRKIFTGGAEAVANAQVFLSGLRRAGYKVTN